MSDTKLPVPVQAWEIGVGDWILVCEPDERGRTCLYRPGITLLEPVAARITELSVRTERKISCLTADRVRLKTLTISDGRTAVIRVPAPEVVAAPASRRPAVSEEQADLAHDYYLLSRAALGGWPVPKAIHCFIPMEAGEREAKRIIFGQVDECALIGVTCYLTDNENKLALTIRYPGGLVADITFLRAAARSIRPAVTEQPAERAA